MSKDSLVMALYGTANKTKATEAQMRALKKAVFAEHHQHSAWPKDF